MNILEFLFKIHKSSIKKCIKNILLEISQEQHAANYSVPEMAKITLNERIKPNVFDTIQREQISSIVLMFTIISKNNSMKKDEYLRSKTLKEFKRLIQSYKTKNELYTDIMLVTTFDDETFGEQRASSNLLNSYSDVTNENGMKSVICELSKYIDSKPELLI